MTNQFIERQMAPIEKETVVEKVIHQLTLAISSGRFKMGQKLPSEFELMDELHVSRNSLREAMKILSAMGIVNIKRGDGTYVFSQVNPSVFDSIIYSMILETSTDEEVIELRQTLDEAVLKLAMKKCTPQQIAQLQNYNDQMRYYFANGEISRAAKIDYQFHIYLTECSSNVFLARIVKGIYQLFEQSIEKNIRNEELFAKADEYHQEIVDCLKNKDFSHIEEVIANSLLSWKENVKKQK
jgi:GntR family transcriptional regulator, transcriptional repressor for pyruvate dehydrogenase complex